MPDVNGKILGITVPKVPWHHDDEEEAQRKSLEEFRGETTAERLQREAREAGEYKPLVVVKTTKIPPPDLAA
jgi:hypothetical protein